MMKKTLTYTLAGCAALMVMGGALIAPSLAAERQTSPQAAQTISTLSAGPDSAVDMEEAKEIALAQAGLTAQETAWLFAKQDHEDGRLEYEVEFRAGSWKYEVDVDAATGAVTSYDQDWKGGGYTQTSTDIGAEKAQAAALAHAGVKAADTLFLQCRPDYEDGLRIYEVESFAGSREYDYEISAADGSVLSFDYDIEGYAPAAGSEYLTAEQAKQIVEQTAGTTGVYTEFKMDTDDGRVLYEGELRSGRMEYEFEIDALTGAVLDWDADWD